MIDTQKIFLVLKDSGGNEPVRACQRRKMTQLSEIGWSLFEFPGVHLRRGVSCRVFWLQRVCKCQSVFYFHFFQAFKVCRWCGCLLLHRETGSEVAKVRKTDPNIDAVGERRRGHSQNRKWLILCVLVKHSFMRKDENANGGGRE